MKSKLRLSFDWKVMGPIAYFPFVISLLFMAYCMTKEFSLREILPALEMSLPAFAAWWSIFLFQDVLEEEGTEVILSLPIPRWKLGTVRVGFFFLVYLFLLIIVTGFVQLGSDDNIFLLLFWQLSVESLFFCSLGFLSMIITMNSSWALIIIISYVSIQILTKGEFIHFTNIYLFNNQIYPMKELANWSIVVLLFGLVMWTIAQTLLRKIKRFN